MTTGPLTADDILGLDVEWLARDADDHVGHFTTAGGGYAPPEFLRDIDAHHAAVAAILAMPASTTPRFAPELGPNATNELVRRRLAGHGDTELSRSAATVAHGHSDPGVPSVRYGEDANWDR